MLCKACDQDKSEGNFYKTNKSTCKDCLKIKGKQWRESGYDKKYYEQNKNKILDRKKKYREDNPEKIKEIQKRCREKNRDKIAAAKREYNRKNKHKRAAHMRKRRKEDSRFRLYGNFSSQIWFALKEKKAKRKWEALVGYSLQDLITHLESLWEPWMNWDNYGNPNKDQTNCWHIDHIIPQSAFDFKTPEDEQFRLCWALNNLRPCEAKVNIAKGNKFIG